MISHRALFLRHDNDSAFYYTSSFLKIKIGSKRFLYGGKKGSFFFFLARVQHLSEGEIFLLFSAAMNNSFNKIFCLLRIFRSADFSGERRGGQSTAQWIAKN